MKYLIVLFIFVIYSLPVYAMRGVNWYGYSWGTPRKAAGPVKPGVSKAISDSSGIAGSGVLNNQNQNNIGNNLGNNNNNIGNNQLNVGNLSANAFNSLKREDQMLQFEYMIQANLLASDSTVCKKVGVSMPASVSQWFDSYKVYDTSDKLRVQAYSKLLADINSSVDAVGIDQVNPFGFNYNELGIIALNFRGNCVLDPNDTSSQQALKIQLSANSLDKLHSKLLISLQDVIAKQLVSDQVTVSNSINSCRLGIKASTTTACKKSLLSNATADDKKFCDDVTKFNDNLDKTIISKYEIDLNNIAGLANADYISLINMYSNNIKSYIDNRTIKSADDSWVNDLNDCYQYVPKDVASTSVSCLSEIDSNVVAKIKAVSVNYNKAITDTVKRSKAESDMIAGLTASYKTLSEHIGKPASRKNYYQYVSDIVSTMQKNDDAIYSDLMKQRDVVKAIGDSF